MLNYLVIWKEHEIVALLTSINKAKEFIRKWRGCSPTEFGIYKQIWRLG